MATLSYFKLQIIWDDHETSCHCSSWHGQGDVKRHKTRTSHKEVSYFRMKSLFCYIFLKKLVRSVLLCMLSTVVSFWLSMRQFNIMWSASFWGQLHINSHPQKKRPGMWKNQGGLEIVPISPPDCQKPHLHLTVPIAFRHQPQKLEIWCFINKS